MSSRRRVSLVLLLVCLLGAIAGQYYFEQLKNRLWDGVFLYGVAVLCFIGLLALNAAPKKEKLPSLWKRLVDAPLAHPLRAAALVIMLLCLYTSIRLNEVSLNVQAVLIWALGIGASLFAWIGFRQEPLLPPEVEGEQPTASENGPGAPTEERSAPPGAPVRADWTGVPTWLRRALGWAAGHWEVLAVAGCTLLALLLRLVRVGTIPYVISGDEASMGLDAVSVLEGRISNPFTTSWLSHPTLYFYMLAGPIAVLGRNAWGLRLLSPFVGAATIPVLYLLARRLFDRRVALAATLLLTVSHLHIHFSRLGINNIYDPLLGLLAFFFLVRGLQEGRLVDFALSGFCLGFGQFFYMGARLIPIMMAVYLLFLLLTRRLRFRQLLGPAAIMGGAFLAAGGPLFYFFALHPDDFMARLGMVGIVQSGWLQTEPLVTGKSVLELLWDQFRKSFLAFNFTLDPTSWYSAGIPYLDAVSGIFFVLGLVPLLRRWREQGPLLVHVWFWLALVFGGVLIENPPSSPRFVIFMPAVCLIAALGLVTFLELGAGLVRLPRAWVARALALILLVAAALNVGYYFGDYTPSGAFGGLNTEVGMRVGEYLRGQEPGSHVYFFGPKRMWVGYATIPFLAPGMDLHDVEEPLTAPPAFVAPAGDVLFVFLPERASELSWVAPSYPGGTYAEVHGHTGEVLFSVYELRR
jgi:4-amino-4-deoxy-L-arabinose transferase-like glycosyltransferase